MEQAERSHISAVPGITHTYRLYTSPRITVLRQSINPIIHRVQQKFISLRLCHGSWVPPAADMPSFSRNHRNVPPEYRISYVPSSHQWVSITLVYIQFFCCSVRIIFDQVSQQLSKSHCIFILPFISLISTSRSFCFPYFLAPFLCVSLFRQTWKDFFKQVRSLPFWLSRLPLQLWNDRYKHTTLTAPTSISPRAMPPSEIASQPVSAQGFS